jgi:bifunctional oligoribonuclease and PAP phosphatase NrnA
MIPWPRFVDIVHSHQRFVLTTHVRTDGDALGSELAMAAILESLGKDVSLCNAFSIPPNLRFLDAKGQHRKLDVDLSAEQLADREVLMIVDTSAWAQLGTMADVVRNFKGLKVVVDHHLSEDDLGAEMFKDVEAEATGRLVVEAADALGVPLTPAIAQPAFVALATDTGWFRFASTNAGTLQVASRLVEAGAVPDQLYKALYENDSHGRLRLIGAALGHTETEMCGRLIHTWLKQSDFAAAEAVPSDSEDIINMTLSVGGTQMAVILVEQPSGEYKASLRSRCSVDCRLIAEKFGGGGHKRAAGITFREPLDSAQQKLLVAVREAMENMDSTETSA